MKTSGEEEAANDVVHNPDSNGKIPTTTSTTTTAPTTPTAATNETSATKDQVDTTIDVASSDTPNGTENFTGTPDSKPGPTSENSVTEGPDNNILESAAETFRQSLRHFSQVMLAEVIKT